MKKIRPIYETYSVRLRPTASVKHCQLLTTDVSLVSTL